MNSRLRNLLVTFSIYCRRISVEKRCRNSGVVYDKTTLILFINLKTKKCKERCKIATKMEIKAAETSQQVEYNEHFMKIYDLFMNIGIRLGKSFCIFSISLIFANKRFHQSRKNLMGLLCNPLLCFFFFLIYRRRWSSAYKKRCCLNFLVCKKMLNYDRELIN